MKNCQPSKHKEGCLALETASNRSDNDINSNCGAPPHEEARGSIVEGQMDTDSGDLFSKVTSPADTLSTLGSSPESLQAKTSQRPNFQGSLRRFQEASDPVSIVTAQEPQNLSEWRVDVHRTSAYDEPTSQDSLPIVQHQSAGPVLGSVTLARACLHSPCLDAACALQQEVGLRTLESHCKVEVAYGGDEKERTGAASTLNTSSRFREWFESSDRKAAFALASKQANHASGQPMEAEHISKLEHLGQNKQALEKSTNTLWIAGICADATELTLMEIFKAHGQILSACSFASTRGHKSGYGVVVYKHLADAISVKAKMNGTILFPGFDACEIVFGDLQPTPTTPKHDSALTSSLIPSVDVLEVETPLAHSKTVSNLDISVQLYQQSLTISRGSPSTRDHCFGNFSGLSPQSLEFGGSINDRYHQNNDWYRYTGWPRRPPSSSTSSSARIVSEKLVHSDHTRSFSNPAISSRHRQQSSSLSADTQHGCSNEIDGQNSNDLSSCGFQAGDWKCQRCGYHNQARNWRCFRCRRVRFGFDSTINTQYQFPLEVRPGYSVDFTSTVTPGHDTPTRSSFSSKDKAYSGHLRSVSGPNLDIQSSSQHSSLSAEAPAHLSQNSRGLNVQAVGRGCESCRHNDVAGAPICHSGTCVGSAVEATSFTKLESTSPVEAHIDSAVHLRSVATSTDGTSHGVNLSDGVGPQANHRRSFSYEGATISLSQQNHTLPTACQSTRAHNSESPLQSHVMSQEFSPQPDPLSGNSFRHYQPHPSRVLNFLGGSNNISSANQFTSSSSKQSLNVNSPSFTPTIPIRSSAMSSRAASAAPFTPSGVASGTATPNMPPEDLFNPSQVREFASQNYETALNGNTIESHTPFDPFHAPAAQHSGAAAQYLNPYLEENGTLAASNTAYYPTSNSYTSSPQPLNHLLYFPIGPHNENLRPYQRTAHDFFMSENLREEFNKKSEATSQIMPNSQLPNVEQYHSLVALDTTHHKSTAIFGYPSWVYKAQSSTNGNYYCLRRIEGFHLMIENAKAVVDDWKRIHSAGCVNLQEVFTTRAFGDSSIVFVYDYHPISKTLAEVHMSNTHRYMIRNPIPETVLWGYIVQIASALKAVHIASLAIRCMDSSKIIVTERNRLRLGACGILDIVQTENQRSLADLQQQDLLDFGKIMLQLAANTLTPIPGAVEQLRHYSQEIKNIINWLMHPAEPSQPKSIDIFLTYISSHIAATLDSSLHAEDTLVSELARELENGRYARLVMKLGVINERPEYSDGNQAWSESGERYMLELFRDYVFHQVDANGVPVVDMAHILRCLNKLDAGTDEKILLTSRDDQNHFVVTYKELKKNVAVAFGDLVKPKGGPRGY